MRCCPATRTVFAASHREGLVTADAVVGRAGAANTPRNQRVLSEGVQYPAVTLATTGQRAQSTLLPIVP